jgi:hypothetical protein
MGSGFYGIVGGIRAGKNISRGKANPNPAKFSFALLSSF